MLSCDKYEYRTSFFPPNIRHSGAKILEESEKAEKEDTSKEVWATRSVVYTLRKTGIPVKIVTDAEAASDYGDELTLSDETIYGYTDGDDGRETH